MMSRDLVQWLAENAYRLRVYQVSVVQHVLPEMPQASKISLPKYVVIKEYLKDEHARYQENNHCFTDTAVGLCHLQLAPLTVL